MSIREELDRLTEKADERTWQKYGGVLDILLNMRAALDISIDAIQENERLRADRDYWRNEYNKSLDQSIRHGEQMMGGMLQLVLQCDIKPRQDDRVEGE